METEFFAKVIPAAVKFIKDSDGKVIQLELSSLGENLKGHKMK